MTSPLVLAFGFVTAAYAFLAALLRFTQDSKEPPVLADSIPFLSPLLGLILGMQEFIMKLRLAILNMLIEQANILHPTCY